MRLSLVNYGLLFFLAAFARADDNCDAAPNEAPFAPSTFAGPPFPGGNDPETKCDSKWVDGEIIVGIEAWSAKFQVKAVRFKFSQSGWGPVRGDVPKDSAFEYKKAEWEATEEVGIKLWNNFPDDGKPMDAVGRIVITRGDQEIFAVSADRKKVAREQLSVDSASGIILGAKTRSGAWLSNIEFKMLKSKVVRAQLVQLDVVDDLKTMNEKKQGMETVTVNDGYFSNSNQVGGSNNTYQFTVEVAKEFSKKITSQHFNQWTGGVTWTVGGEISIPIAKAKMETTYKFEYTRQNMQSTETEWKNTQKLSLSQGSGPVVGMLQPQKAAYCQALAICGTFKGAYTGMIEAVLADGSKYRYKDGGELASVGWSTVEIKCKEMDIKDTPVLIDAGIKEGPTQDVTDVQEPTNQNNTMKVRGLGFFRQ